MSSQVLHVQLEAFPLAHILQGLALHGVDALCDRNESIVGLLSTRISNKSMGTHMLV